MHLQRKKRNTRWRDNKDSDSDPEYLRLPADRQETQVVGGIESSDETDGSVVDPSSWPKRDSFTDEYDRYEDSYLT